MSFSIRPHFALALVLSLTLGTLTAAAVNTDDDIVQAVFEAAGLSRTYNQDASELENLGEADAPFEHLYLFMYQNMKEAPQAATLEQLSARTGYSEDTLELILIDGDLSPWTDDREDSELTEADFQLELVAEYNELQSLYRRELELQEDNRRLSYEAVATEIFMNGDLNDSPGAVDLLHDLDLLHQVIFDRSLELPDRSGDSSVELASLLDMPFVYESDDEVFLAEESADAELDPYACFDDSALRDALTVYEAGGEVLSEGAEDSGAGAGSAVDDSGDAGESSGSTLGGQRTVGTFGDRVSGSGEDGGNAASGEDDEGSVIVGDWSRELPCGDIFCITVDFITENGDATEVEESYERTDNCIACHVGYINEAMEETLSKSLVPSKVSMNFFEDATCKTGWSLLDLDFNVYAIPKPITLDPDDDLEENAATSAEDLKQHLLHLGYLPYPGLGRSTVGKTVSDLECEAIVNLANVADITVDIESAQQNCIDAAQAEGRSIEQAFEQARFEIQIENQDTLYSQMSAELYTMYKYFASFQEKLQATYLNEQAPLQSLTSKQYCT